MKTCQLSVLGLMAAACILLFAFWIGLPKPAQTALHPTPPASPAIGGSMHFETSTLEQPTPKAATVALDTFLEGFEERLSRALEIQDPLERDQVTRQLAHGWAAQDPERAARWALALPDPSERNRMMDFVFSKIAEVQAVRALDLMKNASDKAQPALIGNLVQQWASDDISAACAWANALPPGDSRQEALRRIAFVWSKSDPEKAADFVVQQIAPGPEQTEAAVAVIHQWALRDLPAATAWARQFPEGPLRDRVLAEVSGVNAINN